MATEHEKKIDEFGRDDDFWLFGYGSLIWKPPPHFDQRVPGYIEGYVRRFWQASEDHRGTPEAPGRVATLIDRAHWETLTDAHDSPTERVWGAAYHIPAEKVPEVRDYLDIREINGYSIQFTPFQPAPFTTSISSPLGRAVGGGIGTTGSWAREESPNPLTLSTASSSIATNPPAISSTTVADDDAPTPAAMSSHRHSITASTTISARAEKQSPPLTCLVYIGLPSNPQFLGPQDPRALAKKILESRGPSGENKEYLYALEKSLLELSKDSGDAHVSDLVRRCRAIEREREYVQGGEEEGKPSETGAAIGTGLHKVGSTEEQEEVEK